MQTQDIIKLQCCLHIIGLIQITKVKNNKDNVITNKKQETNRLTNMCASVLEVLRQVH